MCSNRAPPGYDCRVLFDDRRCEFKIESRRESRARSGQDENSNTGRFPDGRAGRNRGRRGPHGRTPHALRTAGLAQRHPTSHAPRITGAGNVGPCCADPTSGLLRTAGTVQWRQDHSSSPMPAPVHPRHTCCDGESASAATGGQAMVQGSSGAPRGVPERGRGEGRVEQLDPPAGAGCGRRFAGVAAIAIEGSPPARKFHRFAKRGRGYGQTCACAASGCLIGSASAAGNR